MNNNFYLLKGETLLSFIQDNERKSIPFSFLENEGYKINEKFNPRLDYIETINNCYFKEEVK